MLYVLVVLSYVRMRTDASTQSGTHSTVRIGQDYMLMTAGELYFVGSTVRTTACLYVSVRT